MIFYFDFMYDSEINFIYKILGWKNSTASNSPLRMVKIDIEKLYANQRITDSEYLLLIGILTVNLQKSKFVDRAARLFNLKGNV